MYAYLPLLGILAAAVQVAPGPDEGCPSARQVSAALLRAGVASATRTGASDSLMLVLPPPGTPMEPSFSLVDDQGRLRLFRTLSKPGAVKSRNCPALADTIALIVQRYLEEVELPVVAAPAVRLAPTPLLAPSAPRASAPVLPSSWDVSLMGSFRIAAEMTGMSDLDAQLALGRSFSWAGQGFAVVLSGGAAGRVSRRWTGGHGTLQRYPGSLALLWRRALGSGELQIGAVGLADLLGMQAISDTGHRRSRWRVASAGAGQAGLRVPVGRSVFFLLVGELGVAAVRFEYMRPAPDSGAALETPLLFVNLRAAVGVSFR